MSDEHLFISYASEDAQFAQWLALRLTTEGYAVWIDRYKLLGGEPYPTDIEQALENGTFRMLAIISHHSKMKENPVKERTKALKIGKRKGIKDFLIPLNLNLKSDEIDWMVTDLTYIPFNRGWASGYRQLLKKMESINAPHPLQHNGRDEVSKITFETPRIREGKETCYSNMLTILKTPATIKEFNLEYPATRSGLVPLLAKWPFYFINKHTILSFSSIPYEIESKYAIKFTTEYALDKSSTIRGIRTENIVQYLILRSLGTKCCEKGMIIRPDDDRSYYFPDGFAEKLSYINSSGAKTWIKTRGSRRLRGTERTFRYYLSPSFKIKPNEANGLLAMLNVSAYVTDADGEPLKKRTENSRIKQLTRDWWNQKSLNYVMAITQLISNDDDKIVVGGVAQEQVVISGRLIRFDLPVVIDEIDAPEEDHEDQDIEIDEELLESESEESIGGEDALDE